MIDAISAIGAVGTMSEPLQAMGASMSSSSGFAAQLDRAIGSVNRDVVRADQQVQALVLGQNASLHGTMIALSDAHVSLELMVQVRNRLVDAYQDVMRMQI